MLSKRICISILALASFAWCGVAASARGEEEKFNYDESKAGSYTLPDPLKLESGAAVTSAAQWESRRHELLKLFESQVYGRRPPAPTGVRYHVTETPGFAGGKGVCKRIAVEFNGPQGSYPGFQIVLYLPASSATRPVPVFVGMHLFDTASAEPVPGKLLDAKVDRELPGVRLMETILARGYGVATLTAAEFCPDDKQKFRQGVLAHLYPGVEGYPGAEDPGAISTWAWALSRTLDYFETDSQVDAKRVTVIGHSRMGKTALWAGAQDQRFAIVISNNSGCGGAALSRRWYGETVARITRSFPHWFCGNFSNYAGKESELPIDQHELIALVAPRPVYVASAVDDGWADPRGEFLAAVGADPVYQLLTRRGLGTSELPELNKPVGDLIGYHIRVGKHALTDYDWLFYLDFADRHFSARSAKAPQ